MAKRKAQDTFNPFPIKICQAKAMLEKGQTHREVMASTGLAKATVQRVSDGLYDHKMPASMLEQARQAEVAKLTLINALILDSVIEDPSVIEEATLAQRADAFSKFSTQSQLLQGLPTSRVDHLSQMGEDALAQELREVRKAILDRFGDQIPMTIEDGVVV